jgi:hypothetical protein
VEPSKTRLAEQILDAAPLFEFSVDGPYGPST